MGNTQSETKKIKTEIMNNTDIQMKFKKVNDTINETTVEVINKVSDSMKVESKTQLKLEIKGGISLKNIKDSSGVKVSVQQELDQMDTVNISSLQNIKQDSSIVQELQKKLSTDMQRAMSSQQESSKSEGEQAMKELMGALTGAVGSAMQVLNPGGSKKSNTDIQTAIKNELKMSNETEIINKTKNIMNNKMITETLTELSSSFETYLEQIVDGDISIDGVENSKDIGIALTQSAKITRDVALEKLNDTSMGVKIMSELLEVDETTLKESVETAQKSADKEQGTLEDLGGAVATGAKGLGEGVATGAKGIGQGVASGVGGVFQALLGPLIVFGVVGIVGLFVLKPMLEKMDANDVSNIMSSARGGKYMKGGSMKKILSKSKSLLSKLKLLLSKLLSISMPYILKMYKLSKPYLTYKNLNIILGLLVGYQIIKFIMSFFTTENFINEQVNKNYYIKVNGKYLKRNDGHIELTDDKKNASLISIVKVVDNVFLKFGEEFAITHMGTKLRVMKNVPLFYQKQKVTYNNDNKSLMFGDKYLSLDDDKFNLLEENSKKSIVELEE